MRERKSPVQPLHLLRFRHRACAFAICLSLVALLAGCSAKAYAKRADREVYRIIANKQRQVFGEERPFRIESAQTPALATADRPLNLEDVLLIAFVNNRDYLTRKESVYIKALSLSTQRDKFRPVFSGGVSPEAIRDPDDVSGDVSASAGARRLLSSGATITLDLASALSMFFTGDPRRAASSLLSFAFVQPLLRNAGKLVTTENLTQAERDVVYELRSFGYFQQSFVVDVAAQYYRTLQRLNVVENEWNNYQTLTVATGRSEALAREGRLPLLQVDQARQDELRARSRWVDAKESYEAALDDFKITLSLPPEQPLHLDPAEIDRLAAAGTTSLDFSPDQAIEIALEHRPDLMTDRDRVQDASRKALVAAKALQGEASLFLRADVGTNGENRPLKFDLDKEGTYSVGADLDLPLERTAERNAYRLALINETRAERDWSLSRDRVKLQVRDSLRRLAQTRENYEIQRRSVDLAERRVESTTMLLEDGRAQTRDLLESQAALVQAKNALAAALFAHASARLECYRDIGVLEVREENPFEAVALPESRPAETVATKEGE